MKIIPMVQITLHIRLIYVITTLTSNISTPPLQKTHKGFVLPQHQNPLWKLRQEKSRLF